MTAEKRKPLFGVYIGRFQPFHNGHLTSIKSALEDVTKLIIVIGSSYAARDPKNPFTFEERRDMITNSLVEEGYPITRFHICAVRDYYYNEMAWVEAVRREVKHFTKGATPILFGHNKDFSSYYLNSFPDWTHKKTKVHNMTNGSCLSATDIRQAMYSIPSDDSFISDNLPSASAKIVYAFMGENHFFNIRSWDYYNKDYPEKLKNYPINVVTADAVVFKSGHVLVVRRGKGGNGAGLIALPGGHVNTDEEPLQGAVRELREETGLKLMDRELYAAHREEKVFAYPNRSLRARVITIAEHFDLGTGSLLSVEGADDADEAFWLPMEDVMMHPEWFFEDHWHIIFYFYNK